MVQLLKRPELSVEESEVLSALVLQLMEYELERKRHLERDVHLDTLLTLHHLGHDVSKFVKIIKCTSVDFKMFLRRHLRRKQLLTETSDVSARQHEANTLRILTGNPL